MPKGALLESSSNFLKNDFWIKRLKGGDFSWVLIISLSKLFEEHKIKIWTMIKVLYPNFVNLKSIIRI